MTSPEHQIYDTDFDGIGQIFETQRRPFKNVDQVLPSPETDLAVLWQSQLDEPTKSNADDWRNALVRKYKLFPRQFVGESELFLLHAMLIAILRPENPPDGAIILFFHNGCDHREDMARTLPVRWLISTATTFADRGQNSDQRSGDGAVNVV